jgi:hypothetical protein
LPAEVAASVGELGEPAILRLRLLRRNVAAATSWAIPTESVTAVDVKFDDFCEGTALTDVLIIDDGDARVLK